MDDSRDFPLETPTKRFGEADFGEAARAAAVDFGQFYDDLMDQLGGGDSSSPLKLVSVDGTSDLEYVDGSHPVANEPSTRKRKVDKALKALARKDPSLPVSILFCSLVLVAPSRAIRKPSAPARLHHSVI